MSGPSMTASSSPANRVQELIVSLDQAAFMARQLPATSDPALLHQIHSTLHHAHHSLSSFLAAPPPVPPPPPPRPSASAAAENSLSSATHNGSAAAEPMQVGEDEEAEEDSRSTSIDRVEERMRNCFIKNKRPKRPLSPSAAAEDEEERGLGGGGGLGGTGFDPYSTRRRALDLVYQFHG
ncbi:WASH complex subunit 1 [Punica granatum]|uniref:Uncharacterized protein n=2 Tax=Punica granatum TaxID=22663 RepID=A0A218VVC3_PUNGR|nr:WASH complex subunit 1 [Punica granatum]OWM64178.1 hypothetical protein CDL15_Pgr018749 [Punica granatum]PKI44326.1 hypothetical protein CRG98_035282 [Punica granatum]